MTNKRAGHESNDTPRADQKRLGGKWWMCFFHLKCLTEKLGLIVVYLILIMVAAQVRESLFGNRFVIEPISVPRELADSGYDPVITAKRLYDGITAAYAEAATGKTSSYEFVVSDPNVEKVPPLAIPSVGPVHSLGYHVGRLFGRPKNSISARITKQPEGKGKTIDPVPQLRGPYEAATEPDAGIEARSAQRKDELHLRIRIGEGEAIDLQSNRLDELLNQAVETILKVRDPYVIAARLYRQEDKAEALNVIKRDCLGDDRDDDDAWAYNLWGKILADRKDHAEAENKYEEAIAKSGDTKEPSVVMAAINFNLGQLLLDREEYISAQDKIRKTRALDAERSASYAATWGWLLFTRGAKEADSQALAEARMIFEEVDASTSDKKIRYWALVGSGAVFLAEGDFDLAKERFEKAKDIKPGFPASYFWLGLLFSFQGNEELAHKQWRAAIEVEPNSELPYGYLGLGLAKLGRMEEAEKMFDDASKLENDKDLGHVYTFWGRMLEFQKSTEKAIEKYEQATKLKEDFSLSYYLWGRLLADQNKHNEAITKYERAVELEPGDEFYHFDLGLAYAATSQNEDAIKELQSGIEKNETWTELGNLHVEFYRFLERNAEGNTTRISELRDSVRQNPEDPVVRVELGRLLLVDRQRDEAIQHIVRAIELIKARQRTMEYPLSVDSSGNSESSPPE